MFAAFLTLFSLVVSSVSFSDDVVLAAAFGSINLRESYEGEKVVYVGDVMLARDIESRMRESEAYPFSRTTFDEEARAVIGNFEGAISPKHQQTPNNSLSFSVHEKYVPRLTKTGFTHMSLANNHSADSGEDGFLNTKRVLADNELVAFGSANTISTSSVVVIENQSHVRSVIALNTTFYELEEDLLAPVFTYAKENSDLLIVYIHWGGEYELVHNEKQEKQAELLSNLGADVIIGHHPHVVQDIGYVNETLVFYSLGNFVFDQYFSEAVQVGLMLEETIFKEGVIYTLIPVTSLDSKGMPRKMNEIEAADFLTELARRGGEEIKKEIINQNIKLEQ